MEFDEIEKCQSSGDWEKSAEILGKAAQGLEAAGADFIMICTNTMHKVAPQISSMIQIPIIHIADATENVLEEQHIQKAGLSLCSLRCRKLPSVFGDYGRFFLSSLFCIENLLFHPFTFVFSGQTRKKWYTVIMERNGSQWRACI